MKYCRESLFLDALYFRRQPTPSVTYSSHSLESRASSIGYYYRTITSPRCPPGNTSNIIKNVPFRPQPRSIPVLQYLKAVSIRSQPWARVTPGNLLVDRTFSTKPFVYVKSAPRVHVRLVGLRKTSSTNIKKLLRRRIEMVGWAQNIGTAHRRLSRCRLCPYYMHQGRGRDALQFHQNFLAYVAVDRDLDGSGNLARM